MSAQGTQSFLPFLPFALSLFYEGDLTLPPNVALPMDAEDYLVPSPQSPTPATSSSVQDQMMNSSVELGKYM